MTALFFSLLLVAGASAQMLARFDALGEQPFFRQPKLKAPRPHMSSRMRSPMSAPGVNVAYDAGPAAMKSYAKKRIEVADSLDAGHLRNYVQQPYLEHDTGNDCSAFPNNTRKHPHIFSCPTGASPLRRLPRVLLACRRVRLSRSPFRRGGGVIFNVHAPVCG